MKKIVKSFYVVSVAVLSLAIALLFSACGGDKKTDTENTEEIVSSMTYKTKLEADGFVCEVKNGRLVEINQFIVEHYISATATVAIECSKSGVGVGLIYEFRNKAEAQDFYEKTNDKTFDEVKYASRQIHNSVVVSTDIAPHVVVDKMIIVIK